MWFVILWGVMIGLILIGAYRASRAETQVLRHWSHLIDGLQYSVKEYYDALEQALKAREIPKSSVYLLDFPEAGPLSAKRIYLRIARGEQRMDVCAAPFGRGFFFSWWLIVPPSVLRLSPILGLLVQAFSPRTYHSVDTAIMFQSAVHDAVQEVIDGITSAKGVRALSEAERKPIMSGFLGR